MPPARRRGCRAGSAAAPTARPRCGRPAPRRTAAPASHPLALKSTSSCRLAHVTNLQTALNRLTGDEKHEPNAFYAVLATKGFFPMEWLDDMASPTSRLGHHPDRTLVPGVEISSGSLGHGLLLAVGVALGLRAQGYLRTRTIVLVGDGELDEGSNHEAIAFAGATGLDSLTVVVVDNSSATHGWPGGIASRFAVNGWSASTVDGHDHDQLEKALTKQHPGRPRVVVAVVNPRSMA